MFAKYGTFSRSSLSPGGVHAEKMAILTAQLANLRAAIHSKDMTDRDKILSIAYGLETKLTAWATTFPSSGMYRSIKLSKHNCKVRTLWGELHLFNGCYQVYPNWESFNSWCYYRVCQIFVNEIILDCLRPMIANMETPGEIAKQCGSIRRTMNQFAADICASAPHAFGIIGESESENEGGSCLGGYMLLLPLFVAGSVEGPTHPLRACALECYQLIAHGMHIGHALADIDILRVRPGVVEWVDELDDLKAILETNLRMEKV